jgi:purine-binding chemotaxis protein CheW
MSTFSVEALRREFDGSFALPLREAAPEALDLLAIRVGDRPFALRLSEVAGVATGRRLTAIPSARPGMLGLLGARGALVAVFDLAVLLGEPASTAQPRWVALASGGEGLAVAFHELEGQLRVEPHALIEARGDHRDLAEHALEQDGELRPVIGLLRLVSRLSGRAISERTGKGS